MLNPTEVAQMVLDNQDAIKQGVGRVAARARLAPDVAADLVSDVNLALLDRRGKSFDPERASAFVFCRMIAWQLANDKLRAMARGGQFSGAYAGFGNAELDAPEGLQAFEASDDYDPNTMGVDRLLVLELDAEADKEDSKDTAISPRHEQPDEQLWVTEARAAVEAIMHRLTDTERHLWRLMTSTGNDGRHQYHGVNFGSVFDTVEYAKDQGIALATAYVRVTRLRAKVRELVAA